MAAAPAKKVTISNLTALFFIGIAVLFDAVKILLLFIDAIPFVGAPIGFIGSWVVSALEFIIITIGLYLAGAYKGKNSTVNTLITMGLGMIDLIPILDDFPSTTIGVSIIIARSRINDKAEALKNGTKNAGVEKQKREREQKEQAAVVAARNADAQRQQAMAISLAAANDNERLSEAA